MARSLSQLRLGASPPPYYLRYTITDTDRADVSARLGALVEDSRHQGRTARVDARVGSPDEDNTNFRGAGGGRRAGVTREDDYAALRRDLWLVTDQEYKRALEALAHKKASHAVEEAGKEKVPDFAKAAPVTVVKDHAAPVTDEAREKIKAAVVALSRVLRAYPAVNASHVDGEVEVVRRRLLTSEKTWTDERWSRIAIEVRAEAVAGDGQRLSGKEEPVRGLSLEGFTPKTLKKDLIAAGKDANVLDDIDYGTPVSVVAPSLVFEDVDVGRPNDKNKRPPLYPSPLASEGR